MDKSLASNLHVLTLRTDLQPLYIKQQITAGANIFPKLFQEWKAYGIEQLKIPTVDFTATPKQEDIDKAVNFILGHRPKNTSVYVHCKAGRTRSATVVACYLVKVF